MQPANGQSQRIKADHTINA